MSKKMINILLKKHGTNDPFEIAALEGIFIVFEKLGKTLGYAHSYNRMQIIHINESVPKAEQKFICAHELGHCLQHPDINTSFIRSNTFFSADKIEREANEFAVELLMPDHLLIEFQEHNYSIYELARIFGVPTQICHLKKFGI